MLSQEVEDWVTVVVVLMLAPHCQIYGKDLLRLLLPP
jgi:hypothetical protein